MNFEATIFNLDGTLVNSMDIWERIDISFLKKRNLTVPENYVAEICVDCYLFDWRYAPLPDRGE